MEKYDAAIIGAGMAGLTAAKKLQSAGKKVVVLEQNGRIGGRLATKQDEHGRADYGAQFFTVRTEEFQNSVDQWLEKGWVKRWFGDDYPRYTSVDGMQGLADHLAEGLTAERGAQITKIVKEKEHFLLKAADGRMWSSLRVLLTMPVPLAAELLEVSGLDDDPLQGIRFKPAYVGIFRFNSPVNLPESGHLDKELPNGVERLVDHHKKGISRVHMASVYMTADWSETRNQRSGVLNEIKDRMKNYFPFDSIHSEELEYWPYAQAVQTYKGAYICLDKEHTFFAAGDAFLRPDDKAGRTRVESAFLSGYDVAHVIMDGS
ncbi:NAD(P)/FAD-dependent oxidoreductase [Halobacillus sp. Marseille-Q1614]|uniref:NAD(P)/FAD-dependent oxidoreductase n=1 Tax=Halobacillus sp. Marseille-Q1614 TaxID=2709134 RepID=UPI002738602D|nr:FAD-dependent oxidoreductase [Halobacillus sp. Marseille-Q1614]